ncbi:GNAT family N-acetyltransferase [Streptomyces griseomycini]|uniref:GNAT superfamily N-acetyltransferase n=1 Tax=Streptomyces griseomycini TaxID=66895 RepID=A0A7W7M2I9_9ACTN|nr:GNAT family N-acetyltransferase [Streptomyces griseomycini]MBB4900487.1 GNAT superfamily N-acetyltransferase [Streptomyces griseomycini]
MRSTPREDYAIRPVRAEEWPAAKELRLTALRDPVAHLAFLESYEDAAGRPDSYWQERTARGAESAGDASGVRQFVAEAADGTWVGTVAVLIEEAGATDWAGFPVERRQGHLVGVYVAPGHRGSGLTGALFDAALEWAWGRGVERVRLIVHPQNARALGFYRKAGFVESGVTVPLAGKPDEHELEMVVERPRSDR